MSDLPQELAPPAGTTPLSATSTPSPSPPSPSPAFTRCCSGSSPWALSSGVAAGPKRISGLSLSNPSPPCAGGVFRAPARPRRSHGLDGCEAEMARGKNPRSVAKRKSHGLKTRAPLRTCAAGEHPRPTTRKARPIRSLRAYATPATAARMRSLTAEPRLSMRRSMLSLGAWRLSAGVNMPSMRESMPRTRLISPMMGTLPPSRR